MKTGRWKAEGTGVRPTSEETNRKESEVRNLTRVLLVVLVSLALAPALVAQEKGRIDTAISSDSRETMAERSSFPPLQPKIYIFAMVADAPKDTPVRAVWIAEKVDGQKPETKFAESTTRFPGGATWIPFSYSKPDPQWAPGTYRVELYLGKDLEAKVKFTITSK
jgi:soluble lytic murein transglycosylase-like protein